MEETLSWNTDKPAACKYSDRPGMDYDVMQTPATVTGGISHSSRVTGLQNGLTYQFYVRCKDTSGNKTMEENTIQPSISNEAAPNFTPTKQIEDVDKWWIGLSRFEPLGSTTKTVDGIVIQSYEPF